MNITVRRHPGMKSAFEKFKEAATVTWGTEVFMNDVPTMVTNVLVASCTTVIDSLFVIDHGHPTAIRFGSDSVSEYSFDEFYKPLFRLLAGSFSSKGAVYLMHCNAGMQQQLLFKFALALGVPCYGGTGDYWGTVAYNDGKWVKCRVTNILKNGGAIGECTEG